MFYFTNYIFFQFIVFTCTVCYYFFKLSAASKKKPKMYYQDPNLFSSLLLLNLSLMCLTLLSQPTVSLPCKLSMTTYNLGSSLHLLVALSFFIYLFINLFRASQFSAQRGSLFLFFVISMLFVFFYFAFSFTTHFELLCIFEYTNALIILYILVSVPTLKPSSDLFKFNIGANFRFMSSYFFLPALLNYFFLLFLVSILLFYFYFNFLIDNELVMTMQSLNFLPRSNHFFTSFLLFFTLLKLGVAPLHF